MVILGTEYAGEMKKGVFTIMNYFVPKRGILSMHCSATADQRDRPLVAPVRPVGHRQDDALGRPEAASHRRRRALLDRRRHLQHRRRLLRQGDRPDAGDRSRRSSRRCGSARCWRTSCSTSDRTTSISRDTSITQNTRGAYPIEFIRNAKIPCVAGHPTDVIFLTCDAFGVLPPVSKLTPAQAMYHFISGYTAKVAGTEMGVTEPQATFSPCFGGPFLVWHPDASTPSCSPRRCSSTRRNVWLVNTGWSGGALRRRQAHEARATRARSSTRSTTARSRTRRPSGTRCSASTVVTDLSPRPARRSCMPARNAGPTRPPTTRTRARSSPALQSKTSRPTRPASPP